MRKCFKCGIEKELSEFYRHPQMKEGRYNKCKECAKRDSNQHREKNIDKYRKYDRERAKLPKRKKKMIQGTKRRRKDKPLAYLAQCIVGNALRSKKITKPKECSICGIVPLRLFGHHEDYYKPLEVIWMCQPCHSKRHKEINNRQK